MVSNETNVPRYTQTCEPCWHCSRSLMRVKGKGYSYRDFTGPDGHNHKVHKRCFDALTISGHTGVFCADDPGWSRDEHRKRHASL